MQAADPNTIKYVSSVLSFPVYGIIDKVIGSGASTAFLYDLTDFMHSARLGQNSGLFNFLDQDPVDAFQQRPEQDITRALDIAE